MLDLGQAFAVRLMQHLVVPTFVLNAQGKVLIWNKACERLTGVKAKEVLGTDQHWQAFYDRPRACLADTVVQGRTDQLGELYETHALPVDRNLGLSAENWCVMPRASKRLYLAIDAGPIYSEDGELVAVVETLRDMTEQKLAQIALQSLVNKDGLTGLANRRSFDASIEADCLQAQREQSHLSLLLVDVDHFKAYNDTYGHQAGDDCLKTVAKALGGQVFRPSDLAARYGGEEFAVLLPGVGLEGALGVAERIRAAVAGLAIAHSGNPREGIVTLSVGVAALRPTPQIGPAALISAADRALYAAKAAGRNRVAHANPSHPDDEPTLVAPGT
ncbi:sensor domain-containing diguanylate cyclase [Roseospirillum parvum]|nr:diguanylate cyclase [Roseospirillum parvum]